jgi:hypothetical protein
VPRTTWGALQGGSQEVGEGRRKGSQGGGAAGAGKGLHVSLVALEMDRGLAGSMGACARRKREKRVRGEGEARNRRLHDPHRASA